MIPARVGAPAARVTSRLPRTPVPPGAPGGVTATAGNGQMTVSGTPPADDGGSAILLYTATSSPGGLTATGTSPTGLVITGLTNDTAYTATMTATNVAGTGPPSAPSNSVTPAGTATYYISTTGNNANPGTQSQPWATFAHAATVAVAGNIIEVAAGTYNQALSPASGASGNPITYRAAAGATVTINRTSGTAISLNGIRDVVIDGFNVTCNSGAQWVSMDGGATQTLRNTIRNCTFTNAQTNGWGFFCRNAHFNQFIDCTLTGHASTNGRDAFKLFDSSDNLCLRLTIVADSHCTWQVVGGSRNILRDSWVENNSGQAVEVHNAANNASLSVSNVIEGNTILAPNFGTDGLASQGCYVSATRTIVRGNVVRDSQGFGIDLEAFLANAADAGSAATDDNRVYHNTAYDNGKLSSGTQLNEDGSGGLSLWKYEAPTSILRNHFKNNIAVLNNMGSTNVQIVIVDWAGSGILSTQRFVNNIVRGTAAGQQVVYIDETGETITLTQAQATHPTQFTGNLDIDPLFVNAAADDYHLQAGSPALGAGANLTTATAAGTNSTSLTVVDSFYFSAGITGGVADGDEIRIGAAAPVRVTAVNYSTHVLTLAAARSWSAGAGVNVEKYMGASAPNIGALSTA